MNRDAYDAIAHDWDGARHRLSADEQRVLTLFTDGLTSPSTLLDLGCGTGRPVATFFAQAGWRIVGLDQSAAMLAIARTRLPEHRWVLDTIESFIIDEPIGAAVAWDSIFHISRDRHREIFERIRAVLPAGGRFAFTAGGSDHPAFTDSMFDHTFFYDSYSPEETLSLLERSGFSVRHHEFLDRPDGGRDKGRIAVIAAAQ